MKYICTKLGNKYQYIFKYAKNLKKIYFFSLLEHIFDTYLKQILHVGKKIKIFTLKKLLETHFFTLQNLKIMHNNEF